MKIWKTRGYFFKGKGIIENFEGFGYFWDKSAMFSNIFINLNYHINNFTQFWILIKMKENEKLMENNYKYETKWV